MNPNKKAEELIEKFGDLAVDVVDEIIKQSMDDMQTERYWQQVKELIINKK